MATKRSLILPKCHYEMLNAFQRQEFALDEKRRTLERLRTLANGKDVLTKDDLSKFWTKGYELVPAKYPCYFRDLTPRQQEHLNERLSWCNKDRLAKTKINSAVPVNKKYWRQQSLGSLGVPISVFRKIVKNKQIITQEHGAKIWKEVVNRLPECGKVLTKVDGNFINHLNECEKKLEEEIRRIEREEPKTEYYAKIVKAVNACRANAAISTTTLTESTETKAQDLSHLVSNATDPVSANIHKTISDIVAGDKMANGLDTTEVEIPAHVDCETCNGYVTERDGYDICATCGICTKATPVSGTYGHYVSMTKKNNYKKEVYVETRLDQLSGMARTKIPQNLIEELKVYFHKRNVKQRNLSPTAIKNAIKALGTGWNSYSAYKFTIYYMLTNKTPPNFGQTRRQTIQLMFDCAREAFERCPPDIKEDRQSFINYIYFFYKVAELCEWDDVLPCLILPQGKKIESLDRIWKWICENQVERKWQFYETVKPVSSLSRFFRIRLHSNRTTKIEGCNLKSRLDPIFQINTMLP
jgi:CRISPR/Cas system CSM-associated protein Csm2 small subunit